MTARATTVRFTPRATLTETDVDLMRHYLPLALGAGIADAFERSVAIGAVHKIKAGPWWPTPRQAPILRRIVERWRRRNLGGTDG